MLPDTAVARARLQEEHATCVLCGEGRVIVRHERGVAPLLALVDEGVDCRSLCAADRVVGKAAAFLYLLLGVREVYAPVMSAPALALLQAHGIAVEADTVPAGIRNRADTGPCPMESAVWDIDNPMAALAAIRRTRAALQAAAREKPTNSAP